MCLPVCDWGERNRIRIVLPYCQKENKTIIRIVFRPKTKIVKILITKVTIVTRPKITIINNESSKSLITKITIITGLRQENKNT